MASVVYIIDEASGAPIDDVDRMDKIEKLLLSVLMKDRDRSSAKTAGYTNGTHKERRLHQLTYADRDFDAFESQMGMSSTSGTIAQGKPLVTVEGCAERGYSIEYYIRHKDGYPISSEAERQRLINCLEAAIKRRNSVGIRLELCCEDRAGLLRDVTRSFREHGLSVTRVEVTTRGSEAVNTFYVVDTCGNPVKTEIVESI